MTEGRGDPGRSRRGGEWAAGIGDAVSGCANPCSVAFTPPSLGITRVGLARKALAGRLGHSQCRTRTSHQD